MNVTRIGIDLAKQVFQLHGVDLQEKVVIRCQLRRSQMHTYFSKLPPCLIGMGACASSHYWASELTHYGHTVRLIPAQLVKPYIQHSKNDANDARGICEALSRPNMRFVTPKSVEQQTMQAEHRVRERLVRARTALSNKIRGLLGEFGIVLPTGVAALRRTLPVLLEQTQDGLTERFMVLLRELAEELHHLDDRLAKHERRIKQTVREDERINRLLDIEGIGPISASALVAAVDDAKQFASGREMAAWLGLVPTQRSSGGKERLGHISRQWGNSLRPLLIHGPRAAVKASSGKTDRRSQWIQVLLERRHANIATEAVANKNARTAWAVLSRGEAYRGAQAV